MNIEVKVDTKGLEQKLADFPVRLAAAQKRILEYIGAAVQSRTTQAFRTASFRPSPWAPRKPSKRDDGHPLLIRSGSLRQSISWRIEDDDTVTVSTDRKYAAFHQHGTKKMPARPFFPVGPDGELVPEMRRKIDREIARIFAEELGEAGG